MSPKTKNYDKKIFRLVYILNKLDRGGKISTRDLSKEFNVTLRTVQRDLELLNMAGFPLAPADKGIHSFTEGFSLKKLMLTKEEASLLSFLYEIAKTLGRNFEESFGGLLKKILSKETESLFYAKIPEGLKLDKSCPFVTDLEIAVEKRRKIEIDYHTRKKQSRFVAHPFKVIFYDGFWFLLARSDEDERMIKLRLENIKAIKLLDKTFEVPANLKSMLNESVNVWFSDQRNKRVVLKVEKEAAKYFKDKKYLPLQKTLKENKDGSLLIEAKVSQEMEVLPTILLWIPYVRVVTPKALKQDLKAIIKDYHDTL
ncbi:MAG: transcriptional regulator [Candidatus Omnitrophica bacterium]|nr:transcriptional regulator [Candidatus Omnitrophota bacterium]